MCVGLVLLAKSTAVNIAADIGSKARPLEFSGDQLASFQEAGMTGGFVIMAAFEDGAAERVVGGNIDTALISEDTRFDLPVGEAGTEGERDVLVHGLESVENEGVSRRRGFDAMGEGGVNKVYKEGWRQEGNVRVVRIIGREEVWSAGEGVRARKEFSGDMDHL